MTLLEEEGQVSCNVEGAEVGTGGNSLAHYSSVISY